MNQNTKDPSNTFKTPSGSSAMRFGKPAGATTNTTGTSGTTGTTTKKRDVSTAGLDAQGPSSSTTAFKRPYVPLVQPQSALGSHLKTPRAGSAFSSSSLLTPNATPSSRLSSLSQRTPSLPASSSIGKQPSKLLPTSTLERQILQLTTENSKLQTALREKESVIMGLERDRRWFEEREEERERQSAEKKGSSDADATEGGENPTLLASLTTLRSTNASLLDELSSLEDAYSSLSRSSGSQISQLKAQVAELQGQLTSTNDLVSELGRVKEERDTLLREVDSLRTAHPPPASPSQASSPASPSESSTPTPESDSQILSRSLHSLTSHIRTLESANLSLTQQNSSLSQQNTRLKERYEVVKRKAEMVEVVREEKRGVEGRIGVLEGLLDSAQSQLLQLQSQLQPQPQPHNPHQNMDVDMDMTTVVSPSPANPATAAAIQELYTLRGAHAKLLDEFGTTRAELLELRSRLSGNGESKVGIGAQDREGGSEDVEVLRRDLKAEKMKRKREEEKRVLYERETKFLKDLVGSYEAERERDSSSNLDNTNANANVLQEELRRLREQLREMERLLEEYKVLNERLGGEVERLGGGVVGSVGDESKKMRWKSVEELVRDYEGLKGDNEKLKEELTQSTTTVSTHLTTIDTLEQTLFELRGEIAGGRHVPPNTRILEMEDNPERRWFEGRKEVVEGLRRENGALMRRLEELGRRVGEWEGEVREQEEGKEQGQKGRKEEGKEKEVDGMVPRESWELVSREKEELEEMVRQKEKRLLRLQQVFTQKSSEFREAIASILGVKLAFYPNGSVRVTSVFDLSASFVFSPSKLDGTTQMQLIAQSEQGGPQDLPSMMHYWIETEQCIPGFLASVTLECWEGSKREK